MFVRTAGFTLVEHPYISVRYRQEILVILSYKLQSQEYSWILHISQWNNGVRLLDIRQWGCSLCSTSHFLALAMYLFSQKCCC